MVTHLFLVFIYQNTDAYTEAYTEQQISTLIAVALLPSDSFLGPLTATQSDPIHS